MEAFELQAVQAGSNLGVSEFLNCDHSIGNFKAVLFSVSVGVPFGFSYFQNDFFKIFISDTFKSKMVNAPRNNLKQTMRNTSF